MAGPDYTSIKSCLEVNERHFEQALAAARSFDDPSPRQKSFALVRRMTEVATPDAGATKLLFLLARIAKRDWLEGELSVKLIGDSELSVLELLVDDGATVERVLGPLKLDVPLDEFVQEVEKNRALLTPLQPKECSARRVVLRGRPDYKMLARKASISAFATELVRGATGHAPAAVRAPDEPAPKSTSFAKADAVLEMPDHLERRPPPPPRRKPR
jgi:hypothetical protein